MLLKYPSDWKKKHIIPSIQSNIYFKPPKTWKSNLLLPLLMLSVGDVNIRHPAQEPEVKDPDKPFTVCVGIKAERRDRKRWRG